MNKSQFSSNGQEIDKKRMKLILFHLQQGHRLFRPVTRVFTRLPHKRVHDDSINTAYQ
jgi:hypothetical protein